MYKYSVSLALFDYIPVILSATGLYFVVKTIASDSFKYSKLTAISACLIVASGLSKASWKLIIATSGVDIALLNNALFVLMTPGFILLTFCLWAFRRQFANNPVKQTAWRCPASIIMLFAIISVYLAFAFPEKRLWFLVLLLPLTLANCVFSFHAIRHSMKTGSAFAALLFLLNIVGIFVMSGLAQTGDQSEAMQWIEEMVNAATQGALALAGYLLWQASENSPTESLAASANS
ncbi:hypothetical protein E2K93_08980 [Thalassotalea sp. HSM 43]|uniref:hypothetical protein n=1 Tax=Thalassotalea sp. HSM 43 TaxID=2552945 RepID=UPI001081B68B|nr:hypothetical protein [Thalassotalea sp. HSM 43]QBY04514.1 hypothetical protein E2K93_08980 [Thalassotalea sp. HSM 43]